MPEDSLDEIKAGLTAALSRLRGMLDRHRTRLDEFAGDLTLWGFVLAAWESASAVEFLVDRSDLGHASFPCARAAFEAAQDALLLATEPDYNRAGARARVFERLEQADIRDETHAAFGDSDAERQALGYDKAVEAIHGDAERWNADCPGKGDLLLDALAYFRPKFESTRSRKTRHPGHWSELSRRRMSKTIGDRVGEPEFSATMIAVYAALSRSAHPRLRMEYWARRTRADGSTVLARPERVLRLACGSTEFAVKLADRAFAMKQPFAVG